MRRMVLIGLAAAVCSGCADRESEWVSPVAFDTATAWVRGVSDSTRLLVELARSDEQRRFGLMSRPRLDENSGMIFQYDSAQPDSAGFWMFRTRMPLDIAFLDSAGVIRRILPMAPCSSDLYPDACDTYEPGVPYWSALEVNQGWFARHGVGEGGTVRLEGAPGG